MLVIIVSNFCLVELFNIKWEIFEIEVKVFLKEW